MRKPFGLSLKVLLFAFTVCCIAIGLYAQRHWQPKIQQKNVAALKELGKNSGGPFTPDPFINVWYDNELIWNESEKRYVIDEHYRMKANDDAKHFPTAIEICCNPAPAELRRLLDKLPTVKQIWKYDRLSVANLLESSFDNKALHEWYPERIIGNAQPNGRRYSDDELK